MLDAYIIDEINRKEEEDTRPVIQLPVYEDAPTPQTKEEPASERGVVVIDL